MPFDTRMAQLSPGNVGQFSDKLETIRRWQLQQQAPSQQPSSFSTMDKSDKSGNGDSSWTSILSEEISHLDLGEAESSTSPDTNRMLTKCHELYEKNTCVDPHEANVFAQTLSTFLNGWNNDVRPTNRLPLDPDDLQFVLCRNWNVHDNWTLILLESNAAVTNRVIVGGESLERCWAVYEFQKVVEGLLWEKLQESSPRALIC
ncbi:hypothetical protein BDV96DRAFT_650126 [Lophiotrema nucula]|uniref:Uncharacterized protein n=1 Tax=Lophiotrema nucula TaxID=690887 RepID=A0A6A5YWV4_9PLEO|nr:hypothetical protein BDV96DRAFT_650126 [Lophiotrema nucula]